MGKYLLLRLAEIYCWVTAPKWVSTPYCIYIYVCISVDMLIYKRKIMCAPSREKGSQPRSSRPPCPGMVAVTILLATVRPFPPRSSRPPRTGMVAVTILVGHCAPLPANIVTPSLPGHGGCDDPWWPMCTPSRAKRNQPRSSHLPCPGMVSVTILWQMCTLSRGKRNHQRSSRLPCPGMVAVTILGG